MFSFVKELFRVAGLLGPLSELLQCNIIPKAKKFVPVEAPQTYKTQYLYGDSKYSVFNEFVIFKKLVIS